MKYFISDTHFGHSNVIQFDGRPFEDADEMDRTMIKNWNRAIGHKDEVYVLGDMFWRNSTALTILPKLNGKKYLVTGNHDKINVDMAKHFVKILPYMELKDNGRFIVLSHFPLAHWNKQYRGGYHFYGHVHNTIDMCMYEQYVVMCKMAHIPFNALNVGAMMPYMDYTPQSLDYLIGQICE